MNIPDDFTSVERQDVRFITREEENRRRLEKIKQHLLSSKRLQYAEEVELINLITDEQRQPREVLQQMYEQERDKASRLEYPDTTGQ